MNIFHKITAETIKIGKLAIPSMLLNSLDASIIIVDMIFLGRLGKGNIAAYSIGNAYFNISYYLIEGFLTSQDTLSAQAVGMNELNLLRSWLYIAGVIGICLCILSTIFFEFSYVFIGYLFNSHITTKAAMHVLVMIPNLWGLTAFRILQKYLLAQNIIIPPIYCAFLGSLINVFLDYIFLSLMQIGFIGVGIATSISRLCMVSALFYYITKTPDYPK